MTNFEKIKSMSVNELAGWLSLHNNCVFCPACNGNCEEENCFMLQVNWLNSETNIDKKPDFTNHVGNALDYPN